MTTSAAVDELRAGFQALANQSLRRANLAALQPMVCAVVDEMMGEGELPERILIAMRRLAVENGLDWENDLVGEPVIRWCLRRYFHPGETGE